MRAFIKMEAPKMRQKIFQILGDGGRMPEGIEERAITLFISDMITVTGHAYDWEEISPIMRNHWRIKALVERVNHDSHQHKCQTHQR
jgi:hypothetical protein